MSTIIDGVSVYFKAGGTKLDIYSSGKNAVKGEYMNAFLDAAKVVHTYAELIAKEYPSIGFGINVAKLGTALNDLAMKQANNDPVVLNDVAAPLLAVTDIIADLALASPSPQLKIAGLIGKGASLMANTALVAFGERVVIPQRDSNKDYGIEVSSNATAETASVSQQGSLPTTASYTNTEQAVRNDYTLETTTLAGATNASMYTATEVTNTNTGEAQYIIRHNGTGETVASGDSYVVNANDTITTTSGDTKFTHSLTDGRLLVMQNADGSGFVVGRDGNDLHFGPGSTFTVNGNTIKVSTPLDAGTTQDQTIQDGQLVQEKVSSDTNKDGVVDRTEQTDYERDGNQLTQDTREDNDGDRQWDRELEQTDTNGDGQWDRREETIWDRQDGQTVQTVRTDANNDGHYELQVQSTDANSDGRFERVVQAEDANQDGLFERLTTRQDANQDGMPEQILGRIDADANGFYEKSLLQVDANQDGWYERLAEGRDANGDGFEEQVIERSDADGDHRYESELIQTDTNGDRVLDHQFATYEVSVNSLTGWHDYTMTVDSALEEAGAGTPAQVHVYDGGGGTLTEVSLDSLSASELRYLGLYTESDLRWRLDSLGLVPESEFQEHGFIGIDNDQLDRYRLLSRGAAYWMLPDNARFRISGADLAMGIGSGYVAGGGWSGPGGGGGGGGGSPGDPGDPGDPGSPEPGYEIPWSVSEGFQEAVRYFGGATNQVSPLILDLDGDGVKADLTEAYSARVYFDIDNDGAAERVGWSNGQDGLLAYDANGNGRIDNITELFGDDVAGRSAFDKLRQWDTNRDGRIDAADADFGRLRLWRDVNHDGFSQASELYTLGVLGVTSISTQSTAMSEDQLGNHLSERASFTRSDGSTGEVVDVHFFNDNQDTWYRGSPDLADNATQDLNLSAIMLPLSRGYGTIQALHLAVSADVSLRRMLNEWVNLKPAKFGEISSRVDDLLYQWAGVRGHDPGARGDAMGNYIDGRKVDFLEKFSGVTWAQRGVDSGVGEEASIGLKRAWASAEQLLANRLLVQGPLRPVFAGARYDFMSDSMTLGDSMDTLLSRAQVFSQQVNAEDRADFWHLVGGILAQHQEQLHVTLADINTGISSRSGLRFFLGEQVLTSADGVIYIGPDGGSETLKLYTQVGSSGAEQIVGSSFKATLNKSTERFVQALWGDEANNSGDGSRSIGLRSAPQAHAA